MTKKKETIEVEHAVYERKSHCLACGNELRTHSILICAECLDDECSEFLKLAETFESDE